MTPKEKATDIFNKMKGFRVKHSHSLKCALIAIEAIIDELCYLQEVEEIKYFEEVKKELELLKK